MLEPNYHRAEKEVDNKDFIINPTNNVDIKMPYIHLGKKVIQDWIKELTAALVWSLIGFYEPDLKWDESFVWSPGFFQSSGPFLLENAQQIIKGNNKLEQYYNDFTWYDGWSAFPKKYPADIYSFDVSFPKDKELPEADYLAFRHIFYNRTSVWYLWIKNPPQSILKTLTVSLYAER